jgi:hypothetical protein
LNQRNDVTCEECKWYNAYINSCKHEPKCNNTRPLSFAKDYKHPCVCWEEINIFEVGDKPDYELT